MIRRPKLDRLEPRTLLSAGDPVFLSPLPSERVGPAHPPFFLGQPPLIGPGLVLSPGRLFAAPSSRHDVWASSPAGAPPDLIHGHGPNADGFGGRDFFLRPGPPPGIFPFGAPGGGFGRDPFFEPGSGPSRDGEPGHAPGFWDGSSGKSESQPASGDSAGSSVSVLPASAMMSWVTVITPARVSVVLLVYPGGPGPGPREFHSRDPERLGDLADTVLSHFARSDAVPPGNSSPRPGPDDSPVSLVYRWSPPPGPASARFFGRAPRPGDPPDLEPNPGGRPVGVRETARPALGPDEVMNPHPGLGASLHAAAVHPSAGAPVGPGRPVTGPDARLASDPQVPQTRPTTTPLAALGFNEGSPAGPPALAATAGLNPSQRLPGDAGQAPRGDGPVVANSDSGPFTPDLQTPLPDPLGSDLLADFQPGEGGALGAAVDQFLQELQDLSDRLTHPQDAVEAALTSWPAATLAVLAGMELGRRFVKREGTDGSPAPGATDARASGGPSGRRGRLAGWPGSWSWTARARIT